MDSSKLIEWIFYGSITLIAGYLAGTITKLRESIEKLNINLAVEIEKICNVEISIEKQDVAIEKIKERIGLLERITYNCKQI